MKYSRAPKGPSKLRPYYTSSEIEEICSAELTRTKLLPQDPGPIRIDRFIEKRFKITPEYGDIGDHILGFSAFGPNGVQGMRISDVFDTEGTVPAARRLRTTLAHEAGHCLLHAHLFVDGLAPANLFGEQASDEPKILCRDVTGNSSQSGYSGNWWEYQANMAIGALLMPRVLVAKAIEPYLVEQGMLAIPALTDGRAKAVRDLAELFDVNPIVVQIRLDELYPAENSGQLPL